MNYFSISLEIIEINDVITEFILLVKMTVKVKTHKSLKQYSEFSFHFERKKKMLDSKNASNLKMRDNY